MTPAEIEERVDRLFVRFERMTDAELIVLRSIWDQQDQTAREDAWTSVKFKIRSLKRQNVLDESRSRLAAWVNNYSIVSPYGAQVVRELDPASIRRQALPPMLDAVAATIVSDAIQPEESTVLLEPVLQLATHVSRP